MPLPGEKPALYRQRMEGYVSALRSATQETEGARRMPTLRNDDAENRKRWTHITRNLAYLPGRLAHVRSAWKAMEGGRPGTLGAEWCETLLLLRDTQNALRDARP